MYSWRVCWYPRKLGLFELHGRLETLDECRMLPQDLGTIAYTFKTAEILWQTVGGCGRLYTGAPLTGKTGLFRVCVRAMECQVEMGPKPHAGGFPFSRSSRGPFLFPLADMWSSEFM